MTEGLGTLNLKAELHLFKDTKKNDERIVLGTFFTANILI